ncbi:MAG: lipid-A-disaccharide synthase [Sedimentisphaerales bacterium]|nr:lipid-A-disaccharide synthase [Sedimentisphaerales bacterium]
MINGQARTIFISAAETSADKHAAALVGQLRRELPEIDCVGLGGPAMRRQGCNLLENLVDRSAMLTHAISQVGSYYKLLGRIKRYFRERRPSLIVVIDSPAWNFHVAKAAKDLGIPVLYYIVPQLWAWGAWRADKLRRRVDRLACILPFEQQWFSERDIQVDYVGHPLFDDDNIVKTSGLRNEKNNHNDFPTIALLPGSRGHEIERLWPVMLKIGCRVQEEFPRARFVTTVANKRYEKILKEQASGKLDVEIRRTSIEAVTRYADLTLVASGTATLEVAAQHCPMIVMYHVNPALWHLAGRWIVKSKYICLVNILADKELVPEFIPLGFRKKQVTRKVLELLNDTDQLRQMRNDLRELIEPIVQPGATKKVVEIIKQMLPNY